MFGCVCERESVDVGMSTYVCLCERDSGFCMGLDVVLCMCVLPNCFLDFKEFNLLLQFFCKKYSNVKT